MKENMFHLSNSDNSTERETTYVPITYPCLTSTVRLFLICRLYFNSKMFHNWFSAVSYAGPLSFKKYWKCPATILQNFKNSACLLELMTHLSELMARVDLLWHTLDAILSLLTRISNFLNMHTVLLKLVFYFDS